MKKFDVINGIIWGSIAFSLACVMAQASYKCGRRSASKEALTVFQDFQQNVNSILSKGEEAE